MLMCLCITESRLHHHQQLWTPRQARWSLPRQPLPRQQMTAWLPRRRRVLSKLTIVRWRLRRMVTRQRWLCSRCLHLLRELCMLRCPCIRVLLLLLLLLRTAWFDRSLQCVSDAEDGWRCCLYDRSLYFLYAVCILVWCSCVVVIGLEAARSLARVPAVSLSCIDSGQVVHESVPLVCKQYDW